MTVMPFIQEIDCFVEKLACPANENERMLTLATLFCLQPRQSPAVMYMPRWVLIMNAEHVPRLVIFAVLVQVSATIR
jgi:hypothetical protein